jgi:hypothetical protein
VLFEVLELLEVEKLVFGERGSGGLIREGVGVKVEF